MKRRELDASSRLQLLENITGDLCRSRLVKGAIGPGRLKRLTRDAIDRATARIGEDQSVAGNEDFVRYMGQNERINTRLLLHSLINGQALFFADCIAIVAELPPKKVFALLSKGSRIALNTLFCQCGMDEHLRNLMARLVLHARNANLLNDEAARHFVVTALIEELIIEHDGNIPPRLQEAFRYLDEQNMVLARAAARGVMPAFAKASGPEQNLPYGQDFLQVSGQRSSEGRGGDESRLSLPAA